MAASATAYPITPPRLPRALPRNARDLVSRAIEAHQAAIDGLIAFLDTADGDTDLEDGADDEPSIGSLTSCSTPDNQGSWAWGGDDDREDEHDGAEPEREL